ncbi:MAG: arginine--tRNA ligase [Bacteroidota bacterium]
MKIEQILTYKTVEAVKKLYNQSVQSQAVQIQKTSKDFIGDLTLVVFPLLGISKKTPEETGKEIGEYLRSNVEQVAGYNVIKGFLNLTISDSYWLGFFSEVVDVEDYGYAPLSQNTTYFMVEYSQPNTNKPQHLGHIRNNLLGFSIAEILKANGHRVIKVNLINDRGIHICKSMLAWQKWGNGETPESSGLKGDKFVGKYYVMFEKYYKEQIEDLITKGFNKEESLQKAPLIIEAREMLRKWEAKDHETIDLWKKMNEWVLKGFEQTYKQLGVDFDKVYYESETYLLGKERIKDGLKREIFYDKDDSSVWCDLSDEGMDPKLLLRSDSTSVYITQDIGTAVKRFDDYPLDKLIYVVGDEQDHHFRVLFSILKKMGYSWASSCYHLSYGMVDLPSGKMKSREGTVVDADDLMEEMIGIAGETSEELGKVDDFSVNDKRKLYELIGLGALKYFILKVDPKKRMLFNPEESIDINGNTGPFIQYTYARIRSVLRKASPSSDPKNGIETIKIIKDIDLQPKEKELIKIIYNFPVVIKEAGNNYSPAIIVNYVYELAKEFNQFYQELPILKAGNSDLILFRLALSETIGKIIKSAMTLLGIDVPERM